MNMVESSEEDDDFPSTESVTSHSKIDTIYQSKTEKGSGIYVLSFWISKMQLKTCAVIRRKNGPELDANGTISWIHFLKAEEGCEDFPQAYCRPPSPNCSWTDTEV